VSRIQLALNVDDLEQAVTFYSKLFGAEPAKRKPGYANYAIAEPPLKLVLIENPSAAPGSINHLGVEVESSERVHAEMESHQNALADVSPQAFEAARRYTLCFAAAACLGLWAHNQQKQAPDTDGLRDTEGLGRVWRDGIWLRAALDRLLVRLGESAAVESGRVDSGRVDSGSRDGAAYEQLLSELCAARDEGELFSLSPVRLAGAREEPQITAEGMPC